MKNIILTIIAFSFLFFGCTETAKNSNNTNESGIKKITVKEVYQAKEYTYLFVKEDNMEYWIATSTVDAKVDEVYYYKDAFMVENFESKELEKTFDVLYMVQSVSKTPDLQNSDGSIAKTPVQSVNNADTTMQQHSNKSENIKTNVSKIKPCAGCVTIADLYKNMNNYSGKKVKVTGKVVKYNAAILSTNWVHLQDGTENNGKFDLTATIATEVNIGDIITIEGVVTLNKDFGYGYYYELLLEESVVK